MGFSLVGCSSLVEMDSSELSQVERIQIDQNTYEKPQFYIKDFKFSKAGRSIASAAPIDGSDTAVKLSNRQLYFLTFYKQYKTLGKILKQKDSIKSCPSFHNVVLGNEKSLEDFQNIYSFNVQLETLKASRTEVVNHPVLAMPYSNKTDLFSVLVKSNFEDVSQNVETALTHYYSNQKKEIETLCDTGVSPGYYIYENLVNYFKNDSEFHATKEGLMALLKVPVISNMIIVDNLVRADKEQFSSSATQFENSLLSRSKVTWFKQYRESVKRARRKLTGSRSIAGEKL